MMLKRLLLVLPFAVVLIGCNKDEEVSSGSAGPPPVATQEQIDSGDAPSAVGMMGGGGAPAEENEGD